MTDYEPDALDGVVAAAEHHRTLFENDFVRVIQTRIPVGDTTAVHTHRRRAAMYVVSGGHYIRRGGDGEVERDSRLHGRPMTPHEIRWSEDNPPHTIENVGSEEIVLIATELKAWPGN